MVLLARSAASLLFPANRRRRTSGRLSRAFGLSALSGAPSQRESMLSWMRSSATPPKIIAPRRPLPRARASVHSRAGWRYQRIFSPAGFSALPVSGARSCQTGFFSLSSNGMRSQAGTARARRGASRNAPRDARRSLFGRRMRLLGFNARVVTYTVNTADRRSVTIPAVHAQTARRNTGIHAGITWPPPQASGVFQLWIAPCHRRAGRCPRHRKDHF